MFGFDDFGVVEVGVDVVVVVCFGLWCKFEDGGVGCGVGFDFGVCDDVL